MKIKQIDPKTKEALAKQYGKENLRLLEIPTNESEDEFVQVAALIPTRQVLSQYMKWSDQNPKKAQEILVRGCIVTDKEMIESDYFMFLTTVSLLAELIPIGQGRIKKF
jgi:hypothetical protein